MALNDKQRKKMRDINNKKKQRILKATDNGRCWWLYQMLTYNPRCRTNQ